MLRTPEGLFLDDEAFKKTYTDALGVACKALGFGADIYRGQYDRKYGGTAPTLAGRTRMRRLRVL